MSAPFSLLTDPVIQDGSVVSRLLLKASGGSATLFAFAPGESLGEHATPREALVVILDGTAEVTVGGETRTLASGEAIHFPANAPHDVRAPEALRMLLVTLKA